MLRTFPPSDPVAPNITRDQQLRPRCGEHVLLGQEGDGGGARRLHQGEDHPLALQRRRDDLRHRLQRKGGLGEPGLVHLRRSTGSHARRPEREPLAGRARPRRRQHAVVPVRIQHDRQDDESDRSGGPGHQFHLRHEQCRSARSPANHGHEQRSPALSSPTIRCTSRSPTPTPRARRPFSLTTLLARS